MNQVSLSLKDLLIDYSEAEVLEACDGFASATIKYRQSLGEEGQDKDLSVWMHTDMYTYAHGNFAMGISDGENMWFFGLRLETPFITGKGNLYQFHKP